MPDLLSSLQLHGITAIYHTLV